MRVNSYTVSKAFIDLFADADIPSDTNIFAAEQDENIILSHLEFAEKLFPHSGLSVCPVSHPRVKYLSKSCEKILGHPHARLLGCLARRLQTVLPGFTEAPRLEAEPV